MSIFVKSMTSALLVAVPFFMQAQPVDEIISKYMVTRGGKEKLMSLKSIYMEGSREMMGNEVTVRVIKEQGKLSRTEFDMAGATGFSLITEKEGWNFFPMRAQTPNQLPAEAVANMQGELDIAGPLVDYAAKGHKLELIGTDSADGKKCFKLKLTPKTGREINYWIDANSYLLIQSSTKGGGGGRRNPGNPGNDGNQTPREQPEILTLYNDYKMVDGILFAHNIEIKNPNGQGRGGGGTTFDKIEINRPVDAKYYKPE